MPRDIGTEEPRFRISLRRGHARGDELGLYKALSECALTAEALAEKTGTDPRYVREWLSSQAASE